MNYGIVKLWEKNLTPGVKDPPPPPMSHWTISDEMWEQGSKMWLRIRKCMMTASNCGVLLKNGGRNTTTGPKLNAGYEALPGKPEPPFEPTAVLNMKHGSAHEKKARDDYVEVIKEYYQRMFPGQNVAVKANDISFYVHRDGILLASPDGEIDVTVFEADGITPHKTIHGLVELKCPASTYFVMHKTARPEDDVTYALWPTLLPDVAEPGRKMARKWAPPDLGRPAFDVNKPHIEATDKSSLYINPSDPGAFDGKSSYSQYFAQCVANLMLSGREWIDFAVWTSPKRDRLGNAHKYETPFWHKFSFLGRFGQKLQKNYFFRFFIFF